jgi:hypothetical protein
MLAPGVNLLDMTWAEEIRPFLQQALRYADKLPVNWSAIAAECRGALTKIPAPVSPLPLPAGLAMPQEEAPAADCRKALADCLDYIERNQPEDAVHRLQDAWQYAEQNEGL